MKYPVILVPLALLCWTIACETIEVELPLGPVVGTGGSHALSAAIYRHLEFQGNVYHMNERVIEYDAWPLFYNPDDPWRKEFKSTIDDGTYSFEWKDSHILELRVRDLPHMRFLS